MFGACVVSGDDMLKEEGYGGECSRWKKVWGDENSPQKYQIFLQIGSPTHASNCKFELVYQASDQQDLYMH
ncbi:unnamed protein product [Lupinus luteus]|uniref:Uncharacterized protein n=1 Tax=Lupinus luteus TaxID=3873 RepID=A0AAV1XD88_LUPLU